MRLFVALALPDSIAAGLAILQAGVPGARWQTREQLHLTLRFIGEVGEDLAADIDGALSRLKARPFILQLAGTGVFGNGSTARSLWVGVERNPPLAALHDKIEQALVRTGLAPEPRKFSPHVTLARLQNPPLDKIAEFLAAHAGFRAEPLAVEAFNLIASYPTKSGSVYEDQAAYPLQY